MNKKLIYIGLDVDDTQYHGAAFDKETGENDLVILCARDTARPFATLLTILDRLDLKLNQEKTQIRDARAERFGFLGFSAGLVKAPRSGKYFPLVEPSDKAMRAIKLKISHLTRRQMNPVPIDVIVNNLNLSVRGWSSYFHYGHGHRKMKQVKYYLEERLRLHLRYRHKVVHHGAAYQRFPRRYIYGHLGLYEVPTTAAWRGVHT
jgi:hypothetical protein